MESGSGTSNSATNYTYDNADKLTQESGAYGTVAYTYDNVGNRLTKTVSSSTTPALVNGTTTSAYDANDRLTSGGHSYDFDGNELSVNGQAATYDFENHLVALSGGTTYTYDADGNRVGVTTGSTTTSYVVDSSLPYASVVEEYNNGTLAARYDYGDDLVRMDRAGGIYYYLYDGLGSTRQLVNTGGTVTDGYYFDAFGEGLSRSPSSGVVNPFLFNAQQFDTASNDYYLRARYYDPSNGRFLSQDPYSGSNEDPVTLHRYLYASNEPVDHIDPGGKEDLVELTVSTGQSTQFDSTLRITGSVATRILSGINNVGNFVGIASVLGKIATGQPLSALDVLSLITTLVPGKGLAKIASSIGDLTALRNVEGFSIFAQKLLDSKNDADNIQNLLEEYNAAAKLADEGKDVEFLQPLKGVRGGDLQVDGEEYEVYSPEGKDSAAKIFGEILQKKVTQAGGNVILRLNRISVTKGEVLEELGKLAANDRAKIKDLIIQE